MTAQVSWISLVVAIFFSLVAVGVIDLSLSSAGRPTVTQFLRESPGWYFYPLAIFQVYASILGMHLFFHN